MQFSEFIQSTFARGVEEAASVLSRDLPACPPGDEDQGLRIAAAIGFSGDALTGTLGLVVNTAGLARIETGFELGDFRPKEDCLREASNLVLGHLRRIWLRRGVDVAISTPILIRGFNIEPCGGQGPGWVQQDFHRDDEHITFWLDAYGDPQAVFAPEDSDHSIADQGEVFLF